KVGALVDELQRAGIDGVHTDTDAERIDDAVARAVAHGDVGRPIGHDAFVVQGHGRSYSVDIDVWRRSTLGLLPLPVRGEGWGEGVTTFWVRYPPHPHPLPKWGEGVRPSVPFPCASISPTHCSSFAPEMSTSSLPFF